MGYLQAEADERAQQLADESARADAAEARGTDLTATLAARDAAIASLQEAHTEQVRFAEKLCCIASSKSDKGHIGRPKYQHVVTLTKQESVH